MCILIKLSKPCSVWTVRKYSKVWGIFARTSFSFIFYDLGKAVNILKQILTKITEKLKKPEVWIPIVIILVLAVLMAFRLYKCPLVAIAGIPCPLCGTTRAIKSVLRGDIEMAFHYHPLWLMTILTAAGIVLHETGILKMPKWLGNTLLGIVIAALLVCYVWRWINHTLPPV